MPLTDADRFPLITQEGQRLLQRLREHPHAPRYTARCGNRLTAEYLARVRDYESEVGTSRPRWPEGGYPAWLEGFVAQCFRDVPFYRRYGPRPRHFADLPTVGRSGLSREIWSFVPDSQPLADLIIYATSGTTGHPLTIPSHPVVGASYTPLIKRALALRGVELNSARGQVACILVGYQRRAYTYPSVTPHQGEAGHIKLNLHPDDWRDPADRARFLDDCGPEIYTGDPIAFAELMHLPLQTRPRALVSTAMLLLPGLRRELEAHFGCPVVDVYSMNESGPLAVADREAAVWHLLQPRTFVEVLDPDGLPCAPGVRGEITLTGGLNFYLPLLRYRTNDFASLEWRAGQPVLVGLQGRPPVVFHAADGTLVNNLDVTNALQPFSLAQFSVHQSADRSLELRAVGASADAAQIRSALLALFGADQPVAIQSVDSLGDQIMQYTSDLS